MGGGGWSSRRTGTRSTALRTRLNGRLSGTCRRAPRFRRPKNTRSALSRAYNRTPRYSLVLAAYQGGLFYWVVTPEPRPLGTARGCKFVSSLLTLSLISGIFTHVAIFAYPHVLCSIERIQTRRSSFCTAKRRKASFWEYANGECSH